MKQRYATYALAREHEYVACTEHYSYPRTLRVPFFRRDEQFSRPLHVTYHTAILPVGFLKSL